MNPSAAQRSAERRLRVHVQVDAGTMAFFRISERDFDEALACHPEVSGRIAVTFGPNESGFDCGVATAEVLLAGNFEERNLSAKAPHLKWVQSIHAGVERLVPLIPSGVTLTHAGGVDAPKAAEFVIAALIMLNTALPRFLAQQREGRWEPIFTSRLAGKTVLILGTGSLGQAVAAEARRFGMTVLGVSRTGRPRPGFDLCDTAARLQHILPRAEFLVVTLPNAPGTRGLIGRVELDLLPPSAGIVNVGRAEVMDYGALSDKLSKGELSGAVLDVFDAEPLPPDSPLWKVPNLLITPHCVIDDAAAYIPRVLDLFFGNVGRYLAGQELRNRVDLTLGY